jgi:hypothetical protein
MPGLETAETASIEARSQPDYFQGFAGLPI